MASHGARPLPSRVWEQARPNSFPWRSLLKGKLGGTLSGGSLVPVHPTEAVLC